MPAREASPRAASGIVLRRSRRALGLALALAVALPGPRVRKARHVARRAGISPIVCSLPTHEPMMSGPLVVLSPSAVDGSGTR